MKMKLILAYRHADTKVINVNVKPFDLELRLYYCIVDHGEFKWYYVVDSITNLPVCSAPNLKDLRFKYNIVSKQRFIDLKHSDKYTNIIVKSINILKAYSY